MINRINKMLNSMPFFTMLHYVNNVRYTLFCVGDPAPFHRLSAPAPSKNFPIPAPACRFHKFHLPLSSSLAPAPFKRACLPAPGSWESFLEVITPIIFFKNPALAHSKNARLRLSNTEL